MGDEWTLVTDQENAMSSNWSVIGSEISEDFVIIPKEGEDSPITFDENSTEQEEKPYVPPVVQRRSRFHKFGREATLEEKTPKIISLSDLSDLQREILDKHQDHSF